jgi:hypothetical protein
MNGNGEDFDINHKETTKLETDIDVIDEFRATSNEIEEAVMDLGLEVIPEKISYLRFLLNDMDEALTGELAWVRHRRPFLKK